MHFHIFHCIILFFIKYPHVFNNARLLFFPGFLNQFLTEIDSKKNIADLCKDVMSVSEVMDKLSAGILFI